MYIPTLELYSSKAIKAFIYPINISYDHNFQYKMCLVKFFHVYYLTCSVDLHKTLLDDDNDVITTVNTKT